MEGPEVLPRPKILSEQACKRRGPESRGAGAKEVTPRHEKFLIGRHWIVIASSRFNIRLATEA